MKKLALLFSIIVTPACADSSFLSKKIKNYTWSDLFAIVAGIRLNSGLTDDSWSKVACDSALIFGGNACFNWLSSENNQEVLTATKNFAVTTGIVAGTCLAFRWLFDRNFIENSRNASNVRRIKSSYKNYSEVYADCLSTETKRKHIIAPALFKQQIDQTIIPALEKDQQFLYELLEKEAYLNDIRTLYNKIIVLTRNFKDGSDQLASL